MVGVVDQGEVEQREEEGEEGEEVMRGVVRSANMVAEAAAGASGRHLTLQPG